MKLILEFNDGRNKESNIYLNAYEVIEKMKEKEEKISQQEEEKEAMLQDNPKIYYNKTDFLSFKLDIYFNSQEIFNGELCVNDKIKYGLDAEASKSGCNFGLLPKNLKRNFQKLAIKIRGRVYIVFLQLFKKKSSL